MPVHEKQRCRHQMRTGSGGLGGGGGGMECMGLMCRFDILNCIK
jgi:hypothetical protein